MEWLLIFYFNMGTGSVSTERLKTYEECMSIGNIISKNITWYTTSEFKCIEVKKL